MFSSLGQLIDETFSDTRQRKFKSLVSCFKRVLLDETLATWRARGFFHSNHFPQGLSSEQYYVENYDFDVRLVTFVEEMLQALNQSNEKEWIRLVKHPDEVRKHMDAASEGPAWNFTLMIDRIDESWDGSDAAVILLMALMHACIQLNSSATCVRPLLFLRENIFDRVRQIDNEFARLETFVVSLDWSEELLLEMVERRLNLPFNTKLPLDGTTWDYFFESIDGRSARSYVFNYCQQRPRDVLTFCASAIESAQAQKHPKVSVEDIQISKGRFSQNRLKDLADEYSENYPQIQLVLNKFYGLGRRFTTAGVTAFIQKLLVDEDVRQYCGEWIYSYTEPERFMDLLYDIGFWGIESDGIVQYRALGSHTAVLPALNNETTVIVHPSYSDALNLLNETISSLDENTPLQGTNVFNDLPDAITLSTYVDKLLQLQNELKTLPPGDQTAAQYEDLVGEIIRLCFRHALTNVEPKVRDVEGRVIRDWIAANRATSGFWEMVRQRYGATQVIWECKNYKELDPGAFHQAAYYMTEAIGRFVVLAFRGHIIKPHYYEHIKRIAAEKQGGVVLLLRDQDLDTFLRQAINGGEIKEDYIHDIFDLTTRMIS
jgi:hypothetical protein